MNTENNIESTSNQSENNVASNYSLDNIDSITALKEYLTVMQYEYSIERAQKSSFENRAGLLLAFIATIAVFLFDKIKISEIIHISIVNLTFIHLIKIFAGILIYSSLLFTVIMIIKTLNIFKQKYFNIADVDEDLLSMNRAESLCKIIITYKDIILNNRKTNKKRAKFFRKVLYGSITMLISILIYLSIDIT